MFRAGWKTLAQRCPPLGHTVGHGATAGTPAETTLGRGLSATCGGVAGLIGRHGAQAHPSRVQILISLLHATTNVVPEAENPYANGASQSHTLWNVPFS